MLTGITSFLHLGIIAGGPDWYRFFGAGEQMAQLAERGSSYPVLVTAIIATVLAVWALYALSGAGLIRRLPLLRLVLVLVALVYLLRGVLGVPIVLLVYDPYFDELESRMTFLVVSSVVCIYLGLCYAVGAAAVERHRPVLRRA
ncbi:MAG: hypothetical protein H0U67_07845 [Gemmatimonadetes bacterium]|nr:hypothetical protein [Gemmatimonadota bacterium]